MHKKSQITLIVIIALVLAVVILISLNIFINNSKDSYVQETDRLDMLSQVGVDFKGYIMSCIDFAIAESIAETGIREETKTMLESSISDRTRSCAHRLFQNLEEQTYDVDEGDTSVEVSIFPDTINVFMQYPIVIERGNERFQFNEFDKTFDRTSIIKIPEGEFTSGMVITSPDGRAELMIPEGVVVTDREGKPVTSIGIKVEDLHFDGLSNNVVIGNLVFEGQPKGAVFSEPIEISINLDDKDIPADVGKENLAISWWDGTVWRSLPTRFEGSRAIAQVNHFTRFAITEAFYRNIKLPRLEDRIFTQRYACDQTYWYLDESFDPPRLVATKAREYYGGEFVSPTSFSSDEPGSGKVIEGISFGYSYYSQGRQIVDCLEDEEFIDENHDFVIDLDKFPDVPCKNIGTVIVASEYENYTYAELLSAFGPNFVVEGPIYPGNLCNGGDGIIIMPESFISKQLCYCQSQTETGKTLGYKDTRCVGGMRDLGNEYYTDIIILEGDGNTCLTDYEVYPISSFGDDPNIIMYERADIDGGNMFVKEVSFNSDGSICTPGITCVDGHKELWIRGMTVENSNEDACAWGAVIWELYGDKDMVDMYSGHG